MKIFSYEVPSIVETKITGWNGTASYRNWTIRFEMNKLHSINKDGVPLTAEQISDPKAYPAYVLALYKAGHEMFIGPMVLPKKAA